MGGELTIQRYENMSDTKLRKAVENDREEMRYESGSSYSGTWASKDGTPNLLGKVFSSEDEAEKFICDNNEKWGPIDIARVVAKQGTETQLKRIKAQREKVREVEKESEIEIAKLRAKLKNKIDKEKTKLDNFISSKGGKTIKSFVVGGWCSS